MMKLLSCHHNWANRVETRFEDGTVLSLDCIAIEDRSTATPRHWGGTGLAITP